MRYAIYQKAKHGPHTGATVDSNYGDENKRHETGTCRCLDGAN